MKHPPFCLTEGEADELRTAYRHCQDAAAKTRYQAVRLSGSGSGAAQVQQICGCPPRTLQHWALAYRQSGPARSWTTGRAATALA